MWTEDSGQKAEAEDKRQRAQHTAHSTQQIANSKQQTANSKQHTAYRFGLDRLKQLGPAEGFESSTKLLVDHKVCTISRNCGGRRWVLFCFLKKYYDRHLPQNVKCAHVSS